MNEAYMLSCIFPALQGIKLLPRVFNEKTYAECHERALEGLHFLLRLATLDLLKKKN